LTLNGKPSICNSHTEFVRARMSCNSMECLGQGRHGGMNSMFINRSAIKLANINAILNFSLTDCDHSVPFTFVDLCGAPGGFSEYLLEQAQILGIPCTMGYGMSLNGTNENGNGLAWKIQEGALLERGLYSKYTICHGADGSGDIFQWNNVVALRNLIRNDSFDLADPESSCVQLLVADGGIDAQREQENQDEITQKLVVCQTTAALELLRRHGTFVIKVFGFQTALIRFMMQDLLSRFESIRIIKPISSRPASAERYVVFSNFHGRPPSWQAQDWQNKILLGVPSSSLLPSLPLYLDTFDRDMLQLNLRACFSILTCLENRTRCEESESEQWVDISRYKQAWRLA
jgi:cap1 methyltransferase